MFNGENKHHVAFVRGEDLPPDKPWLLIVADDDVWFLVKKRHTAAELEEAWSAYRNIASRAPAVRVAS